MSCSVYRWRRGPDGRGAVGGGGGGGPPRRGGGGPPRRGRGHRRPRRGRYGLCRITTIILMLSVQMAERDRVCFGLDFVSLLMSPIHRRRGRGGGRRCFALYLVTL